MNKAFSIVRKIVGHSSSLGLVVLTQIQRKSNRDISHRRWQLLFRVGVVMSNDPYQISVLKRVITRT